MALRLINNLNVSTKLESSAFVFTDRRVDCLRKLCINSVFLHTPRQQRLTQRVQCRCQALVHYQSRAQWLRGRASDSRLREPGFESCAAVLKPWASFFSLYIAPGHSAVQMNTWLYTVVDMCKTGYCAI